MRILVVGGAGYIGSHAVRALLAAGHDVQVFDNLEYGHPESVPSSIFTEGDLAERAALEALLRAHKIEAVMHFAAYASVPESVADPAKYYANNVVGSLNLLETMREVGCRKIVFSSTAATYGVPETSPIVEETPKNPINPYGFTKLVIERALADYAAAYGFGFAVLRYFNACGASSDASIGEDHSPETHLIPIVLQVALGKRENVAMFGTDYPTPDGTCIRDYIHVEDLADAHVRALERIEFGTGMTYNVGTGKGFSVREVVESCRRVTGREIAAVGKPRRPGDPPELVASSDAIRRDLGWAPKFTEIDAIVKSAWKWHLARPNGYAD
jgi:UDP-glucose 4-epimerase